MQNKELVPHWIGNELIYEHISKSPIFNPAYGKIIREVGFASKDVINQAIQTALHAYPSWSECPVAKRVKVLFKFKALIEQHIDTLATLVMEEHGKTLQDAKGSIQRGIEIVEYCCGMPALLKGQYSVQVGTGVDNITIRQPLGVCIGISPFNFPVMIPLWLFIPAIACGNTFVIKPSEQDPSAVMLLAKLLQEAGLPSGVLNVIHGGKEVVEDLIKDTRVKAVAAVGSSTVAQSIYHLAIDHGKRAHTFGGAKNHCVVMPDYDIEKAAESIVTSSYGSSGQRCMAVSVVVAVTDKVGDALVQQLKKKVTSLKVGPGFEENTDISPVISSKQKERILTYIELGVKEGATLVVDGRKFNVASGNEQGFYMGGTLFDEVKTSMRIYQEEIFGPVLCVLRVQNLASAIDLINQHPYGNGTAILTNHGGRAQQFANQVQVGMIGINVPIPVPAVYHAFGGWKHSMFGDVGMHGDQSVQFYTKVKSISSRWVISKVSSMAMPSLS